MYPRLVALLFIAIAIIGADAIAQTQKIDSLKKLLTVTGRDDLRLQVLFSLCDQRQSMPTDTLCSYAHRAGQLAREVGTTDQRVRSNFFTNHCLLKKGLYVTVIRSCQTDIAFLSKSAQPNHNLLLDIMHLKGVAQIRNNEYKESIKESFQILEKAELFQDTIMQAKARNSIGWAYMEMGQDREAITWFQQGITAAGDAHLFAKYPIIYSNIASSYNNIRKFDSALYYINKVIAAPVYDLTLLANANNIKADVFLNLKQPGRARPLLEEALQIRRQIGDPFYIVSDTYQLAVFYANNGQPDKGVATALFGIEEARKHNLRGKLPLLYSGLAESYKMKGDMAGYARVLENMIRLKDTLFQQNSAEALAAHQASYDLQKKENTIIKQKLDILRKDSLITGSVLLFVAIGISLFFGYSNYKHRQQMKVKALIASQKIQEQKAIFEAEESQRKRIAAELHDNMGAQISYITNNIDWILDSPLPLQQVDQTNRLQTIHETSQGLMRTLRETIWALNRDKISLEEFADKLKVYIQTYLQFQPNMSFHCTEQLDGNITLKPIQALNLFRIFQEGVNNAMKYAKAGNLKLELKNVAKQFSICLSDDGTGFDQDRINGEHFGLENMRHRAEEAGFVLDVQSPEGRGTTISISGIATTNANELLTV